jgi:hypothetical protein
LETEAMSEQSVAADTADIEQRFAAAGVVLAPDRRAGAIESAQALLAATHWMRRPRSAAIEPSNTFSLTRVAK